MPLLVPPVAAAEEPRVRATTGLLVYVAAAPGQGRTTNAKQTAYPKCLAANSSSSLTCLMRSSTTREPWPAS